MDCCNDDGCSMDQSCSSCLSPHFVSPMLLEPFDICFPYTEQNNLESKVGYLSNRFILPELHPPASFYLS